MYWLSRHRNTTYLPICRFVDVNRVNFGNGECLSTLLDDATNVFTLASGKFVRSEAPYPGSGVNSCPGSENAGYDPDDDVYIFRGYCRTVISCFAGSELVQKLEIDRSGRKRHSKVPISSIDVSDRVLTWSLERGLQYSEVMAVPHPQNHEVVKFVNIITESGDDLKLTEEHLILAGACRTNGDTGDNFFSSEKLVPTRSSSLLLGDCLLTTQGLSRIVALEEAYGIGHYTIITSGTQEFIVVNGIIASPFAVSHEIGNWIYTPYRVLYATSWGAWLMKSWSFKQIHALMSDALAEVYSLAVVF